MKAKQTGSEGPRSSPLDCLVVVLLHIVFLPLLPFIYLCRYAAK